MSDPGDEMWGRDDYPIQSNELMTARELAKEKPSPSFLQRRMMIGYNRACEIMEMLEQEGLVSKRRANGMREYLGPGIK
jgi:DNA segregation ATPase FtsK/SpoIIIE-like protein